MNARATKTDLEKDNLLGPVKQVRENIFNAKELNDEIIIGAPSLCSDIWKYDRTGMLSEHIQCDSEGKTTIINNEYDIKNNVVIERCKVTGRFFGKKNKITYYNYNYSNTIVATSTYSDEGSWINGRLKLIDTKKNVFDQSDNIIESIFLSGDKVYYKCDDLGNVIEKKEIFNEYGKTNITTKYLYGFRGNVIEKIRNSCDESKINYKYDEKGLLIEVILHGSDSNYLKVIYKYNKYGNTVEEIQYDKKPRVVKYNSFDFNYDNQGNWIRRLAFSWDHTWTNDLDFLNDKVNKNSDCVITLREIEYY